MRNINNIFIILAFSLLAGCASTNSKPYYVTQNQTDYSPATSNSSFVFRSPPPAAVAVVRGR